MVKIKSLKKFKCDIWIKRYFCPHCGECVGDNIYVLDNFCQYCGKKVNHLALFSGYTTNYEEKLFRKTSISKWYNPLTWGKFSVEFKNEEE